MKFIISTVLLFLSFSVELNAQREANNWYFGANAGLSFTNGSPVAQPNGQLVTDEGCAAISNGAGDLLFYTDGITVWDKTHNVMQNGTDLLGDSSSTQSAIIIPKPSSSSVYYIFTVDDKAGNNGLNYSEVDINLNGGNGAVTANKNINLLARTTEKISAISNANETDYWVMAHGWENAEFHAFNVTSFGVNVTPVTTSIGRPHIDFTANTIGYMKFSPNGERLALANSFNDSFVEVFNFNSSTGVLTNPLVLENIFYDDVGAYGIEFSPNSQILYVSDVDLNLDLSKIHQFDITLNTATTILNSDTIIFQGSLEVGALQLAIDRKIYVAINFGNNLGVIQSPNTLGNGANYLANGVALNSGVSSLGLPPFVQSFFFEDVTVENTCLGDTTQFLINSSESIGSITWDFGDGNTSTIENPTHQYLASGSYAVTLTIVSGTTTRVVTTTVVISDVPILQTLSNYQVCDDESNDGIEFFDLMLMNSQIIAGQIGAYNITYYHSSSDAISKSNPIVGLYENQTITEEIFYRIENATNTDCFQVSSFFIEVLEKPELTMEDRWFICTDDSAKLIADSGYDEYLWSNGEMTQEITVQSGGVYDITVTRYYSTSPIVACSTTKSIEVSESNEAVLINVNTVDWSDNENTITVFVEGIGDYEFSLDGINYQDSNVFYNVVSKEHVVYISDKNGCGVIKEEVFLMFYPFYFTPNADSYNDYWQIKFSETEPDMSIYIYDRFGKLLKQISPTTKGWDGTYNGVPMPTNDYWFVVKRPKSGKEYKGHFTLKR